MRNFLFCFFWGWFGPDGPDAVVLVVGVAGPLVDDAVVDDAGRDFGIAPGPLADIAAAVADVDAAVDDTAAAVARDERGTIVGWGRRSKHAAFGSQKYCRPLMV